MCEKWCGFSGVWLLLQYLKRGMVEKCALRDEGRGLRGVRLVCQGLGLCVTVCVCVCITAVPTIKLFAWGKGIVEDMCYERRRAEA